MAEKSGYERYGLTGNPFRDLSSENLEFVEIFHVNQSIDVDLEQIRVEVEEKENKAIILIIAKLGAGKTERLLLIQNSAIKKKHFCVYRNITPETRWVIQGLAKSMLEEIKKRKVGGITQPKWLRDLKRLQKNSEKGYDPEFAGKTISQVLNNNTPAYLLLNDMHGLETTKDMDNFLQTLNIIFDLIGPGVMIIISSDDGFFEELIQSMSSMRSRINRLIYVPNLTNSEAGLMIAKRLLAKRVVAEMQPLYPFTEEAIAVMNSEVQGNPRKMLKLADIIMDYSIKRRVVQINEDTVNQAIEDNKDVTQDVPLITHS
jgi:hypothetical protein